MVTIFNRLCIGNSDDLTIFDKLKIKELRCYSKKKIHRKTWFQILNTVFSHFIRFNTNLKKNLCGPTLEFS